MKKNVLAVICLMLVGCFAICETSETEMYKQQVTDFVGKLNDEALAIFKETVDKEIEKRKLEQEDPDDLFSGPMVDVKIGDRILQIHKAFKEAMDAYESAYYKYVDFLNNPDLSKYAEVMAEFSVSEEAFNRIDENDMTSAELAYYTEVTARIMGKFSEINGF